MTDGFTIDDSSEFGTRAASHLRDDLVVWMTSVTPNGVPQPNPVWFLWDGADSIRLYSQPGTPRVRNIEANPEVSLNFRGDENGEDIVVLNGRAQIEPDAGPAHLNEAYLARYAAGIEALEMTPTTFSESYSVPIRVRLTRLRGH